MDKIKAEMALERKDERIINLEQLLKECEKELENEELSKKIEQLISRKQ